METLSGKTVKRYHMFPQSITQRCDNVQLALDICSRYLACSVWCDIMCDLQELFVCLVCLFWPCDRFVTREDYLCHCDAPMIVLTMYVTYR